MPKDIEDVLKELAKITKQISGVDNTLSNNVSDIKKQ